MFVAKMESGYYKSALLAERGAAWLAHQSGGLVVPSSNLGAPTNKIIINPAAVVDEYGRVFGVEGLFVADASIMPTIPRANTNIPTIMIGERFGEWLRDGVI